MIVLNALRNSKHVSHFSVSEAVEILKKLKPEAAYLTHLSHFVGLHEEVNRKLPDNIQLAYDGLVIKHSDTMRIDILTIFPGDV